ncbi:reverse transcriptase domain-containing protein [Tanacetum coccineum]
MFIMTSRPWTRVFRPSPVRGCDRLVSRAKVIKNQVMAALVIFILSDTSNESVGSHTSRVILFGTIPTIIPAIPEVPIIPADPIVTLEVGTVLVVSPAGVLDLVDYSSSSDSDPSEDSLPPAPNIPLVSPFLCSDDSEADDESEPAELAWRRVSHHSSDHHSSPESSSSSSPSDHSLSGHTPPDTTDADSSIPQRFVHRSLARTPRHSEAFRRWRSAPLSTPYPPTTSESSLGSSSERLLDSSSPSSRPSRKRYQHTSVENVGGNGNPNENGRGDRPVARECTYKDFMKCQPLNFKGTEGVVGLIRNPHKRTIGTDAAFAMSWRELMKLMTEVYCPTSEVQNIETELWNLTMKNIDLAAYTQRFQELTMLCTKMVHEEVDQVERYIGGLPDNIQGNVIAAEPTRLQDAVRIANNLMDQKPNVGGQNVARAYTAGNNEKKSYNGPLPFCNKCKLHHEGPCIVRCGKCNKVGHLTRYCKVTISTTSSQRGQVVNQRVVTCFECGRQGHFRSDCPKLKDQNRRNKAGNKNGVDVSYAVELADERISETNTVLRGCTLGLLGYPFNIDLMPVELGSFNGIISIDWLANHHAIFICIEKVVRIPYGDKVLIVQGEGGSRREKSKLSIISCTKTQKYILSKDAKFFLAQGTKKGSRRASRRRSDLEDVPTVQEFPKVLSRGLT